MANLEVAMVSGSVKTIGSTRHSMRGPGGRWVPRGSHLIWPLPEPRGQGGIDTVTGQWIGLDAHLLHAILPDYSSKLVQAGLDLGFYPIHRRKA